MEMDSLKKIKSGKRLCKGIIKALTKHIIIPITKEIIKAVIKITKGIITASRKEWLLCVSFSSLE